MLVPGVQKAMLVSKLERIHTHTDDDEQSAYMVRPLGYVWTPKGCINVYGECPYRHHHGNHIF